MKKRSNQNQNQIIHVKLWHVCLGLRHESFCFVIGLVKQARAQVRRGKIHALVVAVIAIYHETSCIFSCQGVDDFFFLLF